MTIGLGRKLAGVCTDVHANDNREKQIPSDFSKVSFFTQNSVTWTNDLINPYVKSLHGEVFCPSECFIPLNPSH